MKEEDTIFAAATAPGRAGIAVMRISGPRARTVIGKLCEPAKLPKPREASLRKILHPKNGNLIDRAVVLWFPAPHSFTGEEVAEFHLHGGRAVMNAVTEALRTLPGLRLAEPGEFTRRAFENGKLDLTEAEAIADLVDAETEAQRRQALRQMEGVLGKLYEDWRARLAKVLAYFEASIDFADEDLPQDVADKQTANLRALASEIEKHLADGHRGERLREGFSITIVGAPNAGKSSLLNALARREAAIVSTIPGTTRDVIEVHLDLSGYPVIVADTAGLRARAGKIESEGVRRALKRAQEADLKLVVLDGVKKSQPDTAARKLIDDKTIVVVNKSDLLKGKGQKIANALFISVKTGAGIPELLARLIKEIEIRYADTGTAPLTRARHRAALEECNAALRRALKARASELRAEDVRLAMRALGRITGRVDVEDLLDIIFRDFCIGK